MVAATMPSSVDWSCPDPAWQGITCNNATGRITRIELNNQMLCNPACPLDPALFRAATALSVFDVHMANVAADLSTFEFNSSFNIEQLVLSGNPLVVGPLNDYWPVWMPYLTKLDLSGTTNVVSDALLWSRPSTCRLEML